ncbi:MAG: hypothetical protein ACOYLS_03370 [Polymorphobacter sp.]
MRKIILTAAAIAITSTGMATAVSAKAKSRRPVVAAVAVRVVPVFKAADTNASKSLSSSEFSAAGGNADNFGLIDANNNGELGIFELIRAAVARFMANRG